MFFLISEDSVQAATYTVKPERTTKSGQVGVYNSYLVSLNFRLKNSNLSNVPFG